MTKKQLEDLLSEDWCDKILNYITIEEVNKISSTINKDREKYTVIPSKGSDLFFKAFRVTPYNSLKICILGQDIYHTIDENGNYIYDGLAFSNSNSLKPQPSLKNILTESIKDCPEGDFPNDLDELNLYRWARQGVLLINSAHTVRQSSPGIHIKLWKPFTEAVMKAINEKDDIIHMQWGKFAQSYSKFITNPSHFLIKTSHPSPLGYDKPAPIPFKGSQCFLKANEQLTARNKMEIKW